MMFAAVLKAARIASGAVFATRSDLTVSKPSKYATIHPQQASRVCFEFIADLYDNIGPDHVPNNECRGECVLSCVQASTDIEEIT
eukprot:6468267-Amphidinium_carterae.1